MNSTLSTFGCSKRSETNRLYTQKSFLKASLHFLPTTIVLNSFRSSKSTVYSPSLIVRLCHALTGLSHDSVVENYPVSITEKFLTLLGLNWGARRDMPRFISKNICTVPSLNQNSTFVNEIHVGNQSFKANNRINRHSMESHQTSEYLPESPSFSLFRTV